MEERACRSQGTSVQLHTLPLLTQLLQWLSVDEKAKLSKKFDISYFGDTEKLMYDQPNCLLTNQNWLWSAIWPIILLVYCLHRKRGPPTATMTTPTVSQKRPANYPLTEEHCLQPVDIGSISNESNLRFALTCHNPSPRCPLRVHFSWIHQWRGYVTGPTYGRATTNSPVRTSKPTTTSNSSRIVLR